MHSFIETVQLSQLIKIKHISPSTSVFIVAPPTNSEELQWDHHDQFLEKKQKKLQQSKRLSYHFCRFLFRLFMACYTFRSAGWVRFAVRVFVCLCVCGRLLSMTSLWLIQKNWLAKQVGLSSAPNNNRANHLNDITRKWNVNNTLCHGTRKRKIERRHRDTLC